MDASTWNGEALRLKTELPEGHHWVVIGSAAFWHSESEETCRALGRLLADLDGLVLLTGGVTGVGETVGRAYADAYPTAKGAAPVYHILPRGFPKWDYGITLFAGEDMLQRREILGRLGDLYIVIEGGPGTVHEAKVALSRSVPVIPLGRSAGHAGDLYQLTPQPDGLDAQEWQLIGDHCASPERAAASLASLARQAHAVRWSPRLSS